MLIVLPVLTFAALSLLLLGLQCRRSVAPAMARAVLLEAAAFVGGYMLLFSEVLGLFKLLARPWAGLCWGLALAGIGWFGWRKGLFGQGVRCLRDRWPRLDRFDAVAGTMLIGILALLCLVALVSPPNNNDSLQYHMSRVMHWTQDRSLDHYATAYEPQAYNSIWAEVAILNARLLWGNDRFANMIQWGTLVGALIGVSALAALLGARRRAQWIAIAFAVSLPEAVLQSTSTQSDLITAFWLVALLYFVLLSAKRPLFVEELLALAATLGLGISTKGTFYPLCILPMLYFVILQFRRFKPWLVVKRGLLIAGIVLVFNLGYWVRNTVTYGGPMGPQAWVAENTGSPLNPGAVAGSLTRNIFRNLVTPDDDLNARMVQLLKSAFRSIDPQMESFDLQWSWNHEDLAGNPLHLLLAVATLLLFAFLRRRKGPGPGLAMILILTGSYVLFAALVPGGPYSARYQLPLFVAWAPLFGIALQPLENKWLLPAVTALLLVAALPWVLFNRTRPLIAMRESSDPFTIPCLAGCTSGSILNEPPSSIVFGIYGYLRDPYAQAMDVVRASGCRDVGLDLDSHDLEYLFWWLLDAPQSGLRLETIDPAPELKRYVDSDFRPCAIICTICRGQARVHGLDLVSDYEGVVQIYLGSGYDSNP